jgi:type IX secretion system PorP/SprF family membrane protein
MKKIIYITFLFVGALAYSQDVIFSQNFLVPETLNSSFTGALRSFKAGGIFRSQNRNSVLKTTTKYAFADTYFEGFKAGIGVSLLQQSENITSYTFNQANLNYAMEFRISYDWYFRPSISIGLGTKSFGFGGLVLGDQISLNEQIIRPSIDPLAAGVQKSFFDFSSSILFNNQESWVGLTLRHMNNPNIALTRGVDAPLDVFFSIHSKYFLPVFEKSKGTIAENSKFFLLSNFMLQGNYSRFDLGGQYVFNNKISLGITAATIPLKTEASDSLLSSISTFVGAKHEGFTYGYSYEFNTTELQGIIGGIHEISLSYNFDLTIKVFEKLFNKRL